MYRFQINEYYRLKRDMHLETKIGMLEFFDDDVFTLEKDGTFMVHTGVCMFGIKGDLNDFEFVTEPVQLQIG